MEKTKIITKLANLTRHGPKNSSNYLDHQNIANRPYPSSHISNSTQDANINLTNDQDNNAVGSQDTRSVYRQTANPSRDPPYTYSDKPGHASEQTAAQ